MNLRVRRVQEVFDILATTLWVVTAPRKEGYLVRLRGPLLVLGFSLPLSSLFFQGPTESMSYLQSFSHFPRINPVKHRSVAIGRAWPW